MDLFSYRFQPFLVKLASLFLLHYRLVVTSAAPTCVIGEEDARWSLSPAATADEVPICLAFCTVVVLLHIYELINLLHNHDRRCVLR
jgi:hypothetical protein